MLFSLLLLLIAALITGVDGIRGMRGEALPPRKAGHGIGRRMDWTFVVGIFGLLALLALITIRVPIAYTMILVGGIGTIIQSGPNVLLYQLKDLAYSQFSNYDLSVIPMFILMGGLASRCGLSRDLFRAANAYVGRFRGGIAMAAVAACGGFGAVCGSSTATASTMGQVALPELKRYGYSPTLATGTLAAGGTLGILIPPSVVLIVYAIIVEANIVTLFAAALIPGIIAVIFFMTTVAIYVRLAPGSGPKGDPVEPAGILAAPRSPSFRCSSSSASSSAASTAASTM